MLALHGFWSPRGGLCLWAEDSALSIKSGSRATRSARPHPFAASACALAAIHAGAAGRGRAAAALAPYRSARLTRTGQDHPAPAREVQGRAAAVDRSRRHARRGRGAYRLARARPGIRYGASLGYLADVAAFAGELVARGRVLPALARDQAGAAARWRPFLQGPDAMAVHSFARAMPPVCRAVPGDDDPYELLTAALGAMVDAAAREALPGGLSLTPARRGRRPGRWLPLRPGWPRSAPPTAGSKPIPMRSTFSPEPCIPGMRWGPA